MYRHPNQQFDDFEKYLNGLLTNFNLNNNEYIMTGDFNIDLLKSTSDNNVGSRDDHYPVCRLDIRQDSEFATG